jgi:hypothetical protein
MSEMTRLDEEIDDLNSTVTKLTTRVVILEQVLAAAIRWANSPRGSNEENQTASDLEWVVRKVAKTPNVTVRGARRFCARPSRP